MPSTASALAYRFTHESLQLSVSPDGRYLSALGSGLQRVGGPIAGRMLEDVLADHPEIISLWRRKLRAARPFTRIVEAFGCAWFLEAEPMLDAEGRYVGMSALATALSEGADLPGASPPILVERWTPAVPIPHEGNLLLPGDVLTFDGEHYTYTRVLPIHAGDAIRRRHAERLRPLSAAPPPPPDAPDPRSSPVPHLRVVE